MIFAYSVDYGKSYYLGCGASYQELWDNRTYIPPELTLQLFHETKKYMEFMNFNFPENIFGDFVRYLISFLLLEILSYCYFENTFGDFVRILNLK